MGAAAATCMRNCMHSSTEYVEEVLLHSKTGVPIHASSGSGTGAVGDVKGDAATREGPGQAGTVPPVSNWLQALQRQRAQRTETPRFDEVFQSPRAGSEQTASPRSAGGEFQTPRASPRDSPRSSDACTEPAVGKSEELSYEGCYLGGLKHGAGLLRCTNSTYEGEFQQDNKHGQGTLLWHDGRRYRGQFEHGKFHGTAMMTWPDGRVYDGQYADDRKHGDGTFSWADGRRYQGQWVCGKRHGIGVYTNAKGLTRRGWWQKDRPIHWEPLEGPSLTEPEQPGADLKAPGITSRGPEQPDSKAPPPPSDGGMKVDLRTETQTDGAVSEVPTRPSVGTASASGAGTPGFSLEDPGGEPASPRSGKAAISPRPVAHKVPKKDVI